MARYRSGPRSALLHASIVALAAATTSLWLAKAQVMSVERIFPRLDALSSMRPHVHIALPVRAPRPAQAIPHELPPSLAVDAPAVLVTTAAVTLPASPPPPVPEANPPAAVESASTNDLTIAAPAVAVTPAAVSRPITSPAPAPQANPPAAVESASTNSVTVAEPAPPPVLPASLSAPVVARAVSTAYLRSEPSNDAILTRSLPAGTQVAVLSCTAGCSWLFIQTPDGYQAWSASVWYSIQGNPAGLPAR